MRAILAVLVLSTQVLLAADTPKACLLVRPTEGFQTAFGRVGGKYEYLDSVNMSNPKMNYKKHDLEKLQAQGVHVVVVQRDAKRDEVKQSRESCSGQEKK